MVQLLVQVSRRSCQQQKIGPSVTDDTDRQECIDPFGNLIKLLSQVNILDSITCNMSGSTNKSPNNSMQWKINLKQVICLRTGKTTEEKPYRVNLRSPLPRIHYYQNKRLQLKRILVPNTNLQLNPYPNTQLDL